MKRRTINVLELNMSPADICTAQQKGACTIAGRISFYTKKPVLESNRRIRQALETALRDLGFRFHVEQYRVKGRGATARYAMKHVLDTGYERRTPVSVGIEFRFPFPSTASAKRRARGKEYMTERPDVDNLAKSILDEMSDLRIVADDAQIAVVHLVKARSTQPGITVSIADLTEDEPPRLVP